MIIENHTCSDCFFLWFIIAVVNGCAIAGVSQVTISSLQTEDMALGLECSIKPGISAWQLDGWQSMRRRGSEMRATFANCISLWQKWPQLSMLRFSHLFCGWRHKNSVFFSLCFRFTNSCSEVFRSVFDQKGSFYSGGSEIR
jgi:hypothetical protein